MVRVCLLRTARAFPALLLGVLTGCGAPEPPVPGSAAIVAPQKPEVGPWFVDRAQELGLNVVPRLGDPRKRSVLESLGTGVALIDFDVDRDLDLFLTAGSEVVDGEIRSTGGPWLFRNDGPGRWVDVTKVSGLVHQGWSQGVSVADYDGDGDPDLLILHHGPDRLWQNQGDGTFRDVTETSGLGSDREWGVSATWGDYDRDGWPDLYVANYLVVDPIRPPPLNDYLPGHPVFQGPATLPGQADRLWRNRGDGTFEDVTRQVGLHRPDGKGMSALFCDFDGDGWVDLFVTNDTQPNAFFRNVGSRFEDLSLESGLALSPVGIAEGSMGIDVADLDGDLRFDLLFSNFRQEGSRLFRNLAGSRFSDESGGSTVLPNTQRYVGWGVALADLDDDGHPDLIQANGHVYPGVPDADYDQPALVMANKGGFRFEVVTSAWGPNLVDARSGRGLVAADLDGDGDLDLIMTSIDGPTRVLINDGRRVHRSVEIRLIGEPPNTEALGSLVRLETDSGIQIGQVRRGGSIFSAPDVALHFGLGMSDRIRHITVHWPDGHDSRFSDLPVDGRHLIRRQSDSTEFHPFRAPEAP